VSWNFTNPVPASLTPGLYYVILKADADNTVAESSENDNTQIATVFIGAPDFTVSGVTGVPASTTAGSSLNVAVQAKNLVAFPLSELMGVQGVGNLMAGIYLSVNNQFSTIDDVQLGAVQIPYNQFSNPPLYLNGTATANVSVTIPPGTAEGNYFIFVQLTDGCEQAVNNNLSNAIPIQISGGAPGTYCQSFSNFPWEDWIAGVQISNLNNPSGKSTYSDFTGLTANVNAGQTYPITLTTGFSYFTWDEYWRVWIDYNKDGVFSTPNEVVQQQILTAPAPGTATASVTAFVNIPAWASGTTRMRVSMKRGAFPSACETLPFGEVEDYTVNIGGGGGCSIAFTTANIQCQDNSTPQYPLDDSFTFQITVMGTGVGSQWQMTWNGGSTTGSYGTVKTVGPLPIATFQNGFNFTVADVSTPTCSTTGSLTPPPPCSMPPQVCGFSKTYQDGTGFHGIYGEQTANGYKVVGTKPLVPTGTTFLLLNTDQDGVFTGSTTENISAPMSFAPFRLKDGNYLFLSVTGDQKVKLEKRSSGGTVIWSTTYTIANAEVTNPVNIVEGNNGEIFVTGTVDDSPAGAFFKLFTLKTNSAGVQQWLTTHTLQAGQGNFNAKGLASAQDGGLIVYTTPANTDNHIVRIAGNGNLAWNTMVVPTPFNILRHAAETSDGTILVSYTSDPPTGPTPASVSFAKLTIAGVVEWTVNQTNIFGNIPNPVFIDFAQPFVTGVPGGNFAVVFTGVGGLYMAGLSSNGSTLWTNIHGFTPSIGFFARTADGGYLLTGSLNNQLWLMKTDNQGAICVAPPAQYCVSYGDFPWEDWIARVQLGSLDNSSGKSQYSDFTGLSVNLQKNTSYPITLTTGFSYFTWDEYWRVWIDFNHDGVFSTPDEVVQQQILTAPTAGTPLASVSGSVNIPSGALTGTTRMRVSMKRGGFPTACETIPFGEVEDYTVNITQGLTGEDPDNRADNLNFQAVAEISSVRLSGAYHQPEGVAEVIFEKSTDGEIFLPLATLPGEISDAVTTQDNEPAEGFNFYRLLLNLTSGEVKVSPVRVVSFEPVPDFTVFPNPASTVAYLNLEELLGKSVNIKMLDAQGILMKNIVLDEVSAPVLEIQLDQAPSGLYFFWLETPGRRAVSKALIVEKGF
jgi:hypothetical protein